MGIEHPGTRRSRRETFRRVREVVGVEVCPAVAAAKARLIESGAEEAANELDVVSATAHHLRHALVAALMRLDDPSGACPNCGEPWNDHNAKCHLGRLCVDHR